MTAVASLYDGGATNGSGVAYSAGVFTLTIADMNAVITAYNTANSTSFPLWDSTEDNFEKFLHFLCVYNRIQELGNGLDSYNAKVSQILSGSSAFGSRGSLNAKSLTMTFPFSTDNEVTGDSDNIG